MDAADADDAGWVGCCGRGWMQLMLMMLAGLANAVEGGCS